MLEINNTKNELMSKPNLKWEKDKIQSSRNVYYTY